MKYGLGILISLFLALGGCSEPDESSSLEMRVFGKFGAQALVMGDKYPYFDGSQIFFTKSEFFLSEVAVKNDKGQWVNLTDVNFVNLQNHHFNLENAQKGYPLKLGRIPEGNYTSIRFGVGVPSRINSRSPKDFPASSPLSQGDHYWAGWDSYIFSKTEGVLSDGNQMANFAYHSGFDSVYQVKEYPISLEVPQGADVSVKLELDHSKLFGNAQDFVNIYQDPIIHDGGDFMSQFMSRFNAAISVQ